jgi:hypothetical protein
MERPLLFPGKRGGETNLRNASIRKATKRFTTMYTVLMRKHTK